MDQHKYDSNMIILNLNPQKVYWVHVIFVSCSCVIPNFINFNCGELKAREKVEGSGICSMRNSLFGCQSEN